MHTGRPFGAYSYTGRLGPRVGGVPLLAAAAWALMARPAWIAAGWVARRRAARVALAAGALTAWDVFLDPRMAREGYWIWPDGGAYEGVPASNFLGWWVTGLGVFAVWSALDDAPAGAARRRGAGALRVDVGGRDVRQRGAVAAAAGRRGGGGRDGRGRRARALAAAAMRVVVIGAGVGGLATAVRLAAAGPRRTACSRRAPPPAGSAGACRRAATRGTPARRC